MFPAREESASEGRVRLKLRDTGPIGHHLPNRAHEPVSVQRLHDIAICVASVAILNIRRCIRTGEHDRRNEPKLHVLLLIFQELLPIHVRHIDVEQNEIRPCGLCIPSLPVKVIQRLQTITRNRQSAMLLHAREPAVDVELLERAGRVPRRRRYRQRAI